MSNDEEFENVEGLEPPMLDETWGIKDGDDKETATARLKQNHEPIDDQFKKDFNGESGLVFRNLSSAIHEVIDFSLFLCRNLQ